MTKRGGGADPNPAHQWDTTNKLFSLVEVWALLSVVLVFIALCPGIGLTASFKGSILTFELSSLGIIPDPTINCPCDVSQTGNCINECTIPWM